MMSLFDQVCRQCSALVTDRYSTSFASAIRLLHKDLRAPVHSIYGFVRLADEIVDTFHEQDRQALLQELSADTWQAVERGLSLNPVLHSFQETVRRYCIPQELIRAFLHSMEMDLHKSEYHTEAELAGYVYGSAEVVGLMCLRVFCEGDQPLYETLKVPARKLGAAFQKINFLRDLQADYTGLHRSYFPGFDYNGFDEQVKKRIEADIEQDFSESLEGIRALPWKARFGVYTAYRYYWALFLKIRKMQPRKVLEERVRVSDYRKLFIVMQSRMYHQFNLI